MYKGLSKSRVIAHIQCPRRLWLQTYKPELIADNNQVSMQLSTGIHVGEVARSLYPDGILVTTGDLDKAVSDTRNHLSGSASPLFEAAFKADDILVLADLLIPAGGKWRMIEVKSSASVKPYYITDATIQTWVAMQSGLALESTEIAHIDTSFTYPGNGDYDGLFAYSDISDEVDQCLDLVPEWIDQANQTLSGDEPVIEAGEQCYSPYTCPFMDYCVPDNGDLEPFPPEILPYGRVIAAELRAEGYTDIRDVPLERLSKPRHRRIWEVTRSNRAYLDDIARETVCNLPYPRYFIDFETIQLAVPIWAGTRPYSQIPFQWSCHIEYEDKTTQHFEFLADGKSDPRRDFIVSLLAAVGTEGPVIVYNVGFERTRLKELADYYSDLAPAIHAVIERLFDLLPLAREHYYHQDMHGSWSIKKVLPTIAPDLSYSDLDVGDGGMAMEAFAEMMLPGTSPERHAQLYNALLKYCELDTWAMVVIARYFEGSR